MSEVMDALGRAAARRAQAGWPQGRADAVLAMLGSAPDRRVRPRRAAAAFITLVVLIAAWTLYG